MNIGSEIDRVLAGFQAISLVEVQKASLMRRKDSKYLFGFHDVPDILAGVRDQYRILEISDLRSQPYRSCYYDTPDLEMYHLHHRGKANRHKIRIRKYDASDLHYLEVKKKDSKGVTIKNRKKTNGMDASVLTREEEFLSTYSPYGKNGMIPVLENFFNRITLVSHDQSERITLDYGLRFESLLTDQRLDLPGISIAEIKYEHLLAGSPFNELLRKFHITPNRFSKYAIGAALLHPDLKQGRFKTKVRKVHKLNNSYLQTIKTQQNA